MNLFHTGSQVALLCSLCLRGGGAGGHERATAPAAPAARAIAEAIDARVPWARRPGGIHDDHADDPLHGITDEATPGVFFLAMEGVTLYPGPSHASLDRTTFVSSDVEVPPIENETDRAVIAATAIEFLAPFDVIISTQRPPPWLPYAMLAIGGEDASGLYACSYAWLHCGILLRNDVALVYPACGTNPTGLPGLTGISVTAAIANIVGVESSNQANDVMATIPSNVDGFLDECIELASPTNASCEFVHDDFCPEGAGLQQNAYAELMSVFGPRQVDDTPPRIETSPASGTVVTVNDVIAVTALIEEDSNFLGVHWGWEEGRPAEFDEYTRCTNEVCSQNFDRDGMDPSEHDWPFVVLDHPPVGTYSFRIQAMDAYGNSDEEVVTIEVVEQLPPEDPEPSDDTGEPENGSSTGDLPSATGATDTGDTQLEDFSGGGRGCACRSDVHRPGAWALGLGLLVVGLRRRRPSLVAES